MKQNRKQGKADLSLQALGAFLENSSAYWQQYEKWLFLRAEFHDSLFAPDKDRKFRFRFSPSGKIICRQTLREEFDQFRDLGIEADIPVKNYVTSIANIFPPCENNDVCICLGTKFSEENYANIARGIYSLKDGGVFLCAVANDLGASRYEKFLNNIFPLDFVFSKYHSRVFGFVKKRLTDEQHKILKIQLLGGEYFSSKNSTMLSCPGIFCSDKCDCGSLLLANYLSEELKTSPSLLKGLGADLGSGNGFLSWSILNQCSLLPKVYISGIDLYENEYLALNAAYFNTSRVSMHDQRLSDVKINLLWKDVRRIVERDTYDWIVMNPPFHNGPDKNLSLGDTFVYIASKALTDNGCLYMVANRNLPYEKVLSDSFAVVEKVAENNGFKVFKACH